MPINNLSEGDFTTASQIPFYDPVNGVDRRGSVSELAGVVESLMTGTGGFIDQAAAPGASGFSVTIAPPVAGTSVFLTLTPTGPFAAGTIRLPEQSTAAHAQEVLVSCSQAVSTLTVDGNGASGLVGAPTSLAAGGFFRLRFNAITRTWARVG